MKLFEQELLAVDAALILSIFNGKLVTEKDFVPGFVSNVGGCVLERRNESMFLIGSKDEVVYIFSSLARHGCG